MEVGDKVRVGAWDTQPEKRESGTQWVEKTTGATMLSLVGRCGEVVRINASGDPTVDFGEPPGRYVWPREHVRVIDDEGEAVAPVPTEWVALAGNPENNAKDGTCRRVACDGHKCPLRNYACSTGLDADGNRYEFRWPSGVVGEGKPEFRRVEEAPPVVEAPGSHGVMNAEAVGDTTPWEKQRALEKLGSYWADRIAPVADSILPASEPSKEQIPSVYLVPTRNGGNAINVRVERSGEYIRCSYDGRYVEIVLDDVGRKIGVRHSGDTHASVQITYEMLHSAISLRPFCSQIADAAYVRGDSELMRCLADVTLDEARRATKPSKEPAADDSGDSITYPKPPPGWGKIVDAFTSVGAASPEPEGDWCPACDAHLPADLVCAIEEGDHDCPCCGWRKGRCVERSYPSGKLCNGLLARSWNTQRGAAEMTCIKCGAVEE